MDGLVPLLRSRKDAATLLGISERKVDALLASGDLPKVKIGACVRIDHADIVAFVNSQKKGGL